MKGIAGVAVFLTLLAAAPAAAKPRVIASSVDSGTLPIATADGTLDAPSRGPLIEVRAAPAAALDVSVTVRCYRGQHNRGTDHALAPLTATMRRRLRLPMPNPDHCSVSAFASYEEVEDANGDLTEGRISLKIFR